MQLFRQRAGDVAIPTQMFGDVPILTQRTGNVPIPTQMVGDVPICTQRARVILSTTAFCTSF